MTFGILLVPRFEIIIKLESIDKQLGNYLVFVCEEVSFKIPGRSQIPSTRLTEVLENKNILDIYSFQSMFYRFTYYTHHWSAIIRIRKIELLPLKEWDPA